MVAGIARRLDQLLDNGSRRGTVRIAHAQVDNVLLRGAGLGLISLMTANT